MIKYNYYLCKVCGAIYGYSSTSFGKINLTPSLGCYCFDDTSHKKLKYKGCYGINLSEILLTDKEIKIIKLLYA